MMTGSDTLRIPCMAVLAAAAGMPATRRAKESGIDHGEDGGMCAAAAFGLVSTAAPAGALAESGAVAAVSRAHLAGSAFNKPIAVSSDGTHVWVANLNNSVTELDASTGALVKVIKATRYEFNGSTAVSSDGTHVWVANLFGDSVTELDASTGGLVKVITGRR